MAGVVGGIVQEWKGIDMEKKLFTWDGWDQADTMVFQFYDIVLQRKIGAHEAGSRFDCAIVDYENGKLELDGNVFDLNLVVVNG